ncbi:MAG: ABC transporter substrate-binding protein [Anaerolineae bacterium]|nr:ABC transporter substrate-binding protein [Anaerolineae bacterium]
MKRKVTRREFVRLSVVVSAGLVSACAKPAPTEVPQPTKAPVKATEAPTPVPTPVPEVPKEAPMLAELVKQGKLPPLQDRLPKNPWVAPVAESVGKYGGTMRRAFRGVSDRWGPTKLGDRGLAWFDRNLVMQPRILESWEVSEDAKTWTLHLRPGMKWSDGTPFTADDFVWSYENEWTNTDINPAPPGAYTTGSPRVMMTIEKVDDYTLRYKFAHPNPLFVYKVGRGGVPTPGHYMKQFHLNLVDDKDALQAAAQKAGFNSWSEYYIDRNWWYMNPDKPSVMPWLAANKLSEELFIMQRNPYYFAVDPEGNQLPYIDKVTHRLFETPEVLNLWVTNGEIDFQARHMSMANFTLYKENEAKGGYKVFVGKSAGHLAMNINHTTKNKRLREFFQDRRVRIALNLAINRDEINELVFDGLYTPRQYSPLSMSPQYYPKASNAYIEYNPDKANQLLDEAGYTEKDAQGFRKWKDGSGETISFTFEGTADTGSPDADAAEMVAKYLADVGIKATYKFVERSLYEEHYNANEIEAAWWGGDRTVVPLAPEAPIFRGTMIDRPWACAWGRWLADPSHPAAEEPPADHWIRKIWAYWEQIAQEPNPDKQNELFFKILDIWAEEVPMLGVLGEAPAPIIVKNGFRNYLEGMPIDDTTGDEHLLNTETYFWEEPEKHV